MVISNSRFNLIGFREKLNIHLKKIEMQRDIVGQEIEKPLLLRVYLVGLWTNTSSQIK